MDTMFTDNPHNSLFNELFLLNKYIFKFYQCWVLHKPNLGDAAFALKQLGEDIQRIVTWSSDPTYQRFSHLFSHAELWLLIMHEQSLFFILHYRVEIIVFKSENNRLFQTTHPYTQLFLLVHGWSHPQEF